MKMESLEGFAHKHERVSHERKLSELDHTESNLLQSKLAVLLFNKKREEKGEGERLISSTEKEKWSDEDKELFRQAFFEWIDESNLARPSQSFRDYISNRHPDETIDITSPTAVKQLFEKIMINTNTGGLEQVVQQDLI